MTERYRDAMTLAYGPFRPGTVARAIRAEHAASGFRTCWYCLRPFRPQRRLDDDGRVHRVGRGRWYCSQPCARADRSEGARLPVAEIVRDAREGDGSLVGDVLVLDLRSRRVRSRGSERE